MRSLKFLVPLAIFAVLVFFLMRGLSLNPREVPSPLIGKPAPAFKLATLAEPATQISREDLLGKVWVLNVWASWCAPCREEHPLVVAFARRAGVPVYGLNYKDQSAAAQNWLRQLGDPYAATLVDISHEIPPGDIAAGAYVLARSWGCFPPGTVHLVVVDPGVGSERTALALGVAGHWFVGPDNGLFGSLGRAGTLEAVALAVPGAASPTFHGRDLFAPAAAALASGAPLHSLGVPHRELPVPLPAPEPVKTPTPFGRKQPSWMGMAPTRVAEVGEDADGKFIKLVFGMAGKTAQADKVGLFENSDRTRYVVTELVEIQSVTEQEYSTGRMMAQRFLARDMFMEFASGWLNGKNIRARVNYVAKNPEQDQQEDREDY